MQRWLRQSWLVLLLAGVLGTLLAVVELSLRDRIERTAREQVAQSAVLVVPGGSHSELVAASDRPTWKVLADDGSVRGWAVMSESVGFSDRIRVLVGLSEDRSQIVGVTVLDSRETPGLGERVREASFLQRFVGQATGAELQVVKPGQSAAHSVDAISGATISSKAVTRAVNAATRTQMGSRGEEAR